MKVQLNRQHSTTLAKARPLISILIPVYNEALILQDNVTHIINYLQKLETRYDWELILINDGSEDETGQIAEGMKTQYKNFKVIHHKTNKNLGGALRTGFAHCTGHYIIVFDIDLSYAPELIGRMLDEANMTEADIVVASPYMKGGKITGVPFLRLLLSKTINRLIRMVSQVHIHTYTGMVRLYKTSTIRSLNLKSMDYSINPEIIQKAGILRAKVVEIRAHLDWSAQNKIKNRESSLKIYDGILSGLMTSFIFRPYAFFMIIGAFLLIVAAYVITWIFANTFITYQEIFVTDNPLRENFTRAVATVFKERPHSFIVGSAALIIALQFLSLGFVSLQNKRYFDELFNLSSKILKNQLSDNSDGQKNDVIFTGDELSDTANSNFRPQESATSRNARYGGSGDF